MDLKAKHVWIWYASIWKWCLNPHVSEFLLVRCHFNPVLECQALALELCESKWQPQDTCKRGAAILFLAHGSFLVRWLCGLWRWQHNEEGWSALAAMEQALEWAELALAAHYTTKNWRWLCWNQDGSAHVAFWCAGNGQNCDGITKHGAGWLDLVHLWMTTHRILLEGIGSLLDGLGCILTWNWSIYQVRINLFHANQFIGFDTRFKWDCA